MILINLLPAEYRVQEVQKAKRPYKLIAVGFFSVFFLFSIYQLYLYISIRHQHRGLEAQWQKLAPPNAEAEQLQRELGTSVLAEVDFYNSLVDPLLDAARVLNLIGDLLPQSLILSEAKFVRKGKEFQVSLNGASELSHQESRLIEIQNYANGIKTRLEEFRESTVSSTPVFSGPIKVEVRTSRKRGDSDSDVITTFSATLSTEGFK